jgi:hypothetical protein
MSDCNDMMPYLGHPQHNYTAADVFQHSPRHHNSMSYRRGNYFYSLEVGQQPVRARMCGFGDKDRRPLTPPPCVRLRVRFADSGADVPIR